MQIGAVCARGTIAEHSFSHGNRSLIGGITMNIRFDKGERRALRLGGFTLAEFLVVLAVLAALLAVGTVSAAKM
ncbi:MAG: prepilin-type N-terminal cleavage/methylation domain-containing protein, partial [Oscillospiraceae bacterium]|nr:prepilin-type N-terminal cleavage/methylation domain-containing protein [Oscillospiraceae bacterium]